MKQENTKQKILDKALELFSAQGYDSVGVGEIAKAVGIKAPSLYNHFPSKQAIFDAIVNPRLHSMRQIQISSAFMCRMWEKISRALRGLRRKPFLKKCGRYLSTPSIMIASAASAG